MPKILDLIIEYKKPKFFFEKYLCYYKTVFIQDELEFSLKLIKMYNKYGNCRLSFRTLQKILNKDLNFEDDNIFYFLAKQSITTHTIAIVKILDRIYNEDEDICLELLELTADSLI